MSSQINKDILVFVHPNDPESGRASRSAYRLLALARTLTKGKVIALSPQSVWNNQLLASAVDQGYILATAADRSRWQLGAVLAQGIKELIQAENLDLGAILLPSTNWGKESAAQLGVFLQVGASVDVTNVSVNEQGAITAQKSVLGGTWETTFALYGTTPVLAVRALGLPVDILATGDEMADQAAQLASDSPATLSPTVFEMTENSATSRILVVSRKPAEAGKQNLAEAAVAVCGGRGTQGDFQPIYRLAHLLGGSVGATRVACEEGWIDRSTQVGQSGLAISPNLYLGFGISGDPHHTCGIRGAKTIVAVCDDPQAAIFRLADFGVVGDYQTVISQVNSLLEARLASQN